MAEPENKKILRGSIAGLALLSVFLLSFQKIYDYDVWFHLEAGEYIIKNLTIPVKDVFSYTAYGNTWITHEWLYEVIIYFIHLIGGINGLILFKAALVTPTFGYLLAAPIKRGVSPFIAAPVIAAAAVLASERFLERPELVSYLFVALYLYYLERFRAGKERGGYLWILPAVMLFWANTHSGAIFGIILIGAYGAGEVWGYLFEKDRYKKRDGALRIKKLSIIFAVTILAGFLNPNTYQVYTYPFFALDINARTGLNIAEYTPPAWPGDSLFFILMAVAVLIVFSNIKRVPLSHLGLFVLFSLSALRYSRNIALWAIISAPIVAIYLDASRQALTKERFSEGIKSFVLSAMVVILLTASTVSGLVKNGSWGLGIKENWFPEGAVSFLEKAGIGGNMFNSYEFGGYLIWRTYPERKVYIDGRSDVYIDLLIEQMMLGKLGFENIVEKHKIDYAVFSYNLGTPEYINPDPYFGQGLALVYWDDASLVYLKRTPENAETIKRNGYNVIRPTDMELKYARPEMAEGMMADLRRNISDNPGGWRNHILLGNLYAKLGKKDLAEKEYAAANENISKGKRPF